MERITLRLQSDQLAAVDELVDQGDYSSRSEAIREALSDLMDEPATFQRDPSDDHDSEPDEPGAMTDSTPEDEPTLLSAFDNEDCAKRIRRARFGTRSGASCPHCDSAATVKRGTTSKDAQRFWCKNCETYFNDLTGTVFSGHQLSLTEMFYILSQHESMTAAAIARDLQRNYEPILNFINKLQQTNGAIAGVKHSRLVDPEIRGYNLRKEA